LKKLKDTGKDYKHTQMVHEKYEKLAHEIIRGEDGEMICVTSAKNYEGMDKLLKMIKDNSSHNKVILDKSACLLYEQLGKIGLKKRKTGDDKTSQEQPKEDVKSTEMPAERPHDTTADSSNNNVESQSSNQLHSFPYIEFDSLLESYEIILDEIAQSKSDENKGLKDKKIRDRKELTEKLSNDLKQLHYKGLLFYFYNVKELRHMIFNDIGEFIQVLKKLLHHNYENHLTIEQIHKDLYGIGDNQFSEMHIEDLKKDLKSKGMMSCILLKNICLNLKIEMSSLLSLLVHLNVACPVPPKITEASANIKHAFPMRRTLRRITFFTPLHAK
jgi:hypothetical protein